nr:hypothetical protein [uncultured Prevotella sp.]
MAESDNQQPIPSRLSELKTWRLILKSDLTDKIPETMDTELHIRYEGNLIHIEGNTKLKKELAFRIAKVYVAYLDKEITALKKKRKAK